MKYTFAINEVDTVGRHKQTGNTVTVETVNETLARSVAKAQIYKGDSMVLRYHPGQLLKVEETHKDTPASSPNAPEPSRVQ